MPSTNHKSDQKRDASLTRKPKHFMVSASPFNGVKLDLAIILIVGIVFFIIVTQLVQSFTTQLLALSLFGLVAMMWIVHKTRKILRTYAQEQNSEDSKTH